MTRSKESKGDNMAAALLIVCQSKHMAAPLGNFSLCVCGYSCVFHLEFSIVTVTFNNSNSTIIKFIICISYSFTISSLHNIFNEHIKYIHIHIKKKCAKCFGTQ